MVIVNLHIDHPHPPCSCFKDCKEVLGYQHVALDRGLRQEPPDFKSVALVGKTRPRALSGYANVQLCASTPFDLSASLVKRGFQLDPSVESFLLIRRPHWQEDMWNSILWPYLEPVPGIYNQSTRPFPFEIFLTSMAIFFLAPSFLLSPGPPLWSSVDLPDKMKWSHGILAYYEELLDLPQWCYHVPLAQLFP